jgi:hypothetical protein
MRRALPLVLLLLAATPTVFAWGARGHRTITCLAIDGLPADAPAWMRDPATRLRIADESNEPDRLRGTPLPVLGHENDPEHYLDVEDLEQFGLTLETISPFRYDYVRDMAVAKYVHPEMVEPYDPTKDKDHAKEWPGFLPHAIAEHYARLRASFNTLRILDSLNDTARAEQLLMARENCIHEMGMLSHFVGDGAQPLHTTRHHHGWVGENPNHYTTDRGFHSYIDTGVVEHHGLTVASVFHVVKFGVTVNADDPWAQTIRYIRRSFEKVEPLYILQRDGQLQKEAGKEFIIERFADAASMLSAMYWAAWTSSKPDERQVQAWVKFNNLNPSVLAPAPAGPGAPAGPPAPPSPTPATEPTPAVPPTPTPAGERKGG